MSVCDVSAVLRSRNQYSFAALFGRTASLILFGIYCRQSVYFLANRGHFQITLDDIPQSVDRCSAISTFWNLCIILMFVLLVVLHSRIPYIQIGSIVDEKFVEETYFKENVWSSIGERTVENSI